MSKPDQIPQGPEKSSNHPTSGHFDSRPWVLVTGASSGIGAATARFFAQKAWGVFLLGRSEERLQAVAQSCARAFASSVPSSAAIAAPQSLRESTSPSLSPSTPSLATPPPLKILVCDLRKGDQIEAAISQVKEVCRTPQNPLEGLVNSSGVYVRAPFLEGGMSPWRDQFEVNLFGHLQLTQGLLPLMVERRSGAIVNVSSTFGFRPGPLVSAYCASKAAMNMWTQALAMEMGPYQVRVNALCPGIVDTPIHPFHAQEPEKKQKSIDRLKDLQPLGRIGTPEEIARSVYFLISPQESSWTTGAILSVDGGISLV